MTIGWSPQFLTGYWLEASVSCQVAISTGCLRVLNIWQLVSPRVSDPRERLKDKNGSHIVFYNLISKVTILSLQPYSTGHTVQFWYNVGGDYAR